MNNVQMDRDRFRIYARANMGLGPDRKHSGAGKFFEPVLMMNDDVI